MSLQDLLCPSPSIRPPLVRCPVSSISLHVALSIHHFKVFLIAFLPGAGKPPPDEDDADADDGGEGRAGDDDGVVDHIVPRVRRVESVKEVEDKEDGWMEVSITGGGCPTSF